MKLVTERGNGFYSWNGKLFQSDIIRSCIRPKYKAIGKLNAKHIREAEGGNKINPEPYMKFLLEEPNPFMTGQLLQEKLTIQLQLNNNAFALIVRGQGGVPKEIYPIPGTGVQVTYDDQNKMRLKFTLKNGNIIEPFYSDVIHLRQDFNENDIFGENPKESLDQLMEVVNTTDQGIVKAIKNGAIIRWLLKFKQTIRPEDKEKELKKFVDNYLSIENEVGAAATDPKYEAEQVEPNDYVPNAKQMDRTTKRIYNFFNTNEKIVQSKYNEDEWNAYYESEIEPLARQMSEEFTRKLFTRKERGHGNKIVFEASSLQYASMKTKINLVHMVDRGALTPNEWREIMNLGSIEGGDKPIRRKDTGEVGGGDLYGDKDSN
ncbi:phage portal protein [Sporohalobacter salinus]|uniref:phage portal protein n=1 Tax=Sporohalobacter salinus TaxID=1494606 RepID=UPI003B8381A1